MSSCCQPKARLSPWSFILAISLAILFYIFSTSTLFSALSVNSSTLPPVFFLFGLVAGLSTCSATLSSLFLSLKPRFSLFAAGRIISFSVLGLFLGFLGNYFRLSFSAINIVNILVSVFILYQSLKLLGVLKISSKYNIKPLGKGGFVFGLSSFFIPCGFTLTAQSLALASASPVSSSLILFFFALGSLVPLFFINRSLKFLNTKPIYSQTLAFLLLFFSLFSLNNQIKILPIHQVKSQESIQSVLHLVATNSGYTPNYFKVKAGSSVRLEVEDRGTSGCTNAIIARSLFEGRLDLVPGTTSVKEFIAPTKPGRYRFSCWMGMISGTIEVVK
jgi:sulfite exporter TauE/SafE